MSEFVLEIKWTPAGVLPRLVGPFGLRAEAQEWAHLNIPNGSWNVAPLAYPYATDEGEADEC